MDIEYEKSIVEKMIRLYCRKQHHRLEICDECSDTLQYSKKRLDACPYKADKPSCKKCEIHCYRSDKAEQIKKVMQFSGPKLIFYYPLDVLKYYFYKKKHGKHKYWI